MGMHYGILAAEMSWPELLGHLEQRAGTFVDRGPVERMAEADFQDTDDHFSITAGELDGKAYLGETSYLLSGGVPDLITEIAAASGKRVVGCGAETASGSYHLIAAEGQELLRYYHHCHMALSRPFEWGDPLATELESPLNGDLYGQGLLKALGHLGFDFDAWQDHGARRCLFYTPPLQTEAAMPEGPLGRALKGHYEWHSLRPEERPRPKVVVSGGAPAAAVGNGFVRGCVEALIQRFFS